jgi:DUF1009 family protein
MSPFWRNSASRDAGGPVALLAGSGDLPLLFAQAARSLKTDLVIIGLEGITDPRLRDYASQAHFIEFGALARIPEILKSAGVKKVAMAGGVPKKKIYDPSAKIDSAYRDMVGKMRNQGDDHILRGFEVFLKIRCGVSVIDPRRFLKGLLATKGPLTRRIPTDSEWKDLSFGRDIARGIGKMDIGQTVVVKQLAVLAVEALEGTDAAIRRGGSLAPGSVVVKTAKPNQDLRFDLPCVGEETLESMRAAGCSTLGVEAGKTLMLFKDQFIARADRDGVAIVGI